MNLEVILSTWRVTGVTWRVLGGEQNQAETPAVKEKRQLLGGEAGRDTPRGGGVA